MFEPFLIDGQEWATRLFALTASAVALPSSQVSQVVVKCAASGGQHRFDTREKKAKN